MKLSKSSAKYYCLFVFQILISASLFVIIFNNKLIGSELKRENIDETENGNVYFYYEPQVCELILSDITDISYIKTVRIAQVKLAETDNANLIIDYSEGGSVDPGFIVYSIEPSGLKKISNLIDGLNAAIPGDGYIYIWGHTNSYFNLRRKFSLINGQIKEVRQPFNYVGLDTVTLTDIQLFETKAQETIVAQLTKGASVTVLLNSDDFYLLKTNRDIVGWWLPQKKSYFKAEEIEGVYWNGD